MDLYAARLQHRSLLVQRFPPLHTEVHQRHVNECNERTNGGTPSPGIACGGHIAKSHHTGVQQEQQQGAGTPGIPYPPKPPGGASPDGSEHQRETGEHHTDGRRCAGDVIPERLAGTRPQPQQPGQRCHAERHIGHPRSGRVHVQQPHRLTLDLVGPGDEQSQHGEYRQRRTGGETGEPTQGLHR